MKTQTEREGVRVCETLRLWISRVKRIDTLSILINSTKLSFYNLSSCLHFPLSWTSPSVITRNCWFIAPNSEGTGRKYVKTERERYIDSAARARLRTATQFIFNLWCQSLAVQVSLNYVVNHCHCSSHGLMFLLTGIAIPWTLRLETVLQFWTLESNSSGLLSNSSGLSILRCQLLHCSSLKLTMSIIELQFELMLLITCTALSINCTALLFNCDGILLSSAVQALVLQFWTAHHCGWILNSRTVLCKLSGSQGSWTLRTTHCQQFWTLELYFASRQAVQDSWTPSFMPLSTFLNPRTLLKPLSKGLGSRALRLKVLLKQFRSIGLTVNLCGAIPFCFVFKYMLSVMCSAFSQLKLPVIALHSLGLTMPIIAWFVTTLLAGSLQVIGSASCHSFVNP